MTNIIINEKKRTIEMSKKDYTNRKVLLEHFSTSNCNNCPVAHRNIDNALLYRNDVIHVVHHAGMGTDFLTIPAHEDYLYFFGEKVYTPAVMLDRTNMSPYGVGDGAGSSSTPGPAFFPVSATLGKVIDQSLSVPAVVTVDINRQYDAATRKLQVVVTGDVTQVDLPEKTRSGLVDALHILKGIDGIAQVYLTEKDVVRHRLVQQIVKAYERAAQPPKRAPQTKPETANA